MALTITEALAEIKTVGKRVEKKREFIKAFLARQDGVKDPLEKDGGSFQEEYDRTGLFINEDGKVVYAKAEA